MANQISLFNDIAVADMPATYEHIIPGLDNVDNLEVQIDWKNLSGSGGSIEIDRQVGPNNGWNYLGDATGKFDISTTDGAVTFQLTKWAGQKLRIRFIKGSLTGGTVTAGAGLRKIESI